VIETYSFGTITIRGKEYTDDVLIFRETVFSWWRTQGHVLNPEDLSKIKDDPPKTLVVGTGVYGRLKIPEKTKTFLQERNISLIAEKTEKACTIFNELPRPRAAALHLTC